MMKITIGAVTTGGSCLLYKTGNWRDQRPVIDTENCKACGICKEVCPDSSVYVRDEVYRVDYDFCKGCGLCAYECPVGCIRMIPEEK